LRLLNLRVIQTFFGSHGMLLANQDSTMPNSKLQLI
jgi:hypothetical protein